MNVNVVFLVEPCNSMNSESVVGYLRLFIVATGCPSERRPQQTGDSARIQDETI